MVTCRVWSGRDLNSAMDASSASGPKTSLLKQYYPYIFTLNHYLNVLIPSKQHDLAVDDDPETYRTLLATSFVATHTPIKDIPKFPYFLPQCSQSELMDRAHGELFKRGKTPKKRPANVLLFGYRVAETWDEDGKLQPGRLAISNYAINSMVTTLTGHDWSLLLQRIGEGPMLHLLVHTSIFLHLQHGSFCQATGKPIYDTEPIPTSAKRFLSEDLNINEKSGKNRGISKQGSIETAVGFHSASTIKIDHLKIFYGRPEYQAGQRGVFFGLPHKHVLNRLGEQGMVVQRPEVDESTAQVEYLAKHIFPRQFGLSNVFVSKAQSRTPYGHRDLEIKTRLPGEIPRRLQPVLPLIQNLIYRHHKTNYFFILERTCLSKVQRPEVAAVDVLEFLSKTAQTPDDQLPIGRSSSLVEPQQEQERKSGTKLAEYGCTHGEVSRFALRVTVEVIPSAFWGTEENFQHISRRIVEFIECRRYENSTLHGLLQGLQLSKFDWTFLPRTNSNAGRPLSDTMKGRELVEEFLYWYFDSFLIPLLRTTFYATESSIFRNRILFFRHDDWKTLCKPLMDKICSERFVKVPEDMIKNKDRQLGHSSVRLLPKETGARLIVNLGKRPVSKGIASRYYGSVNDILQTALHILTYEKHNQSQIHRASVNSHSGIYFKLKDFKNANRLPNGLLPKLYFVKMDVHACFDSIEQGKLLDIIRRTLTEKRYMLQKYTQTYRSRDRVKRNFTRRAFADDDHQHFLSIATDLATSLRHAVFTDQVVHTFEERKELLALIEEHISSHIVEIGGNFYKQKVGIPQGSVISTILCNFFYEDLESSSRFDFMRGPAQLLLRYIDDYFFVSTSLENAKQFLAMMNEGHPEYGCFISKEKTETNFSREEAEGHLPSKKIIHWCGLLINTTNLDVSVDSSRHQGTRVADSLTVHKGRQPGSNFRHKILSMATSKNHLLFMDTTFNSEFTVYSNIYENFLMMAMKVVQYLKDWNTHTLKHRTFILTTLKGGFLYSYRGLQNLTKGSLADNIGVQCTVRKEVFLWFGYQALRHVLLKKRAHWREFYTEIEAELKKPRYRSFAHQPKFVRVLRVGEQRLKGIVF